LRGILIRSCAMYPGLGPRYIRLAVKGHEANLRLLKEMTGVLEE
jgi:threonine-phosphate decarboxylase